jgi:hypothetical protein
MARNRSPLVLIRLPFGYSRNRTADSPIRAVAGAG